MEIQNGSAAVEMRERKREFTYGRTAVLTFSSSYPEIVSAPGAAAERINRRVRLQEEGFYRYASTVLYRQAVKEYRDSLENGFPFRPYDAVLNYEVTLNGNCYFSLYRDRYEYTGGAHGNTVRSSDTWSLKTGNRLALSDFFMPGENYRMILTEQILLQADENMRQNPGIYFEDYRALIVKFFHPESFYLTPEGLNIYYQQYEIAPYSTGIVVFTVGYETLGWRPSCR